MIRFFGILALHLALLFPAAPQSLAAQERVAPKSQTEMMLSFAPVVKATAPAVVNIFSKRQVVQRFPFKGLFNDPFFERFFGRNFGGRDRKRIESSLGSGVIVDPSGLIVTNHHVIEGATEIRVVLTDRREFAAEIAFLDQSTDLAVLMVDTKGKALPTIDLKDSDDVEVGDIVLALGNPFGVGQTVTSGIVSALARTQVQVTDFGFFIQTDAAINPGNSGGALVTLDGRLIGINTAIFSKTGGSVGIGFAIPTNMVRTVIAAAKTGRLVRPWIGFAGQTITADLAEGLRLDRPGGVIVSKLLPGGSAERAGLKPGDLVVAFNGYSVEDVNSLRFRAATSVPGDDASLEVLRNGRTRDLVLRMEEAPEDPPRRPLLMAGSNPLAGAEVASLSPALSEELDLHGIWQGTIVTRVKRRSPAHQVGFRKGDIIHAVNRVSVSTSSGLLELLGEMEGKRQWEITFTRDGKERNAKLEF